MLGTKGCKNDLQGVDTAKSKQMNKLEILLKGRTANADNATTDTQKPELKTWLDGLEATWLVRKRHNRCHYLENTDSWGIQRQREEFQCKEWG